MCSVRLAHAQPLILAIVLVLAARADAQEPPVAQFGTPAASTRPILLGPVELGEGDDEIDVLPLPPGAARLLVPLPLATGLPTLDESPEGLRAQVTALECENRELLNALQRRRLPKGEAAVVGVAAQDVALPRTAWPPAPEPIHPPRPHQPSRPTVTAPKPPTSAPVGPRYQYVEGIEYQQAERYVWCAVPETASCGCVRTLRWLTSWWPFNRDRCGACPRRRWALRRVVQRVPVTVYYRVPCAASESISTESATSAQSTVTLPRITESYELRAPRVLPR